MGNRAERRCQLKAPGSLNGKNGTAPPFDKGMMISSEAKDHSQSAALMEGVQNLNGDNVGKEVQ